MQDKRPRGLGLGAYLEGPVSVVKISMQFSPPAKTREDFGTTLQDLVEKIPSKYVVPHTTSQTIVEPLPKIQSHPTPENGVKEEIIKKERDTTEAKDTSVGLVVEAKTTVHVAMVVEETTREGEETIHGEKRKKGG